MKAFHLVLLSTFLFIGITAFKTSHEICGVVTDETGETLIGASIIEKGTENGVATDIDGKFCLHTKSENPTLVVSYTGFNTIEVEAKKEKELKITLAEGVKLDEVVVTSLGVRSEKKSMGYATSTISSHDISRTKPAKSKRSKKSKTAKKPHRASADIYEAPLYVADGMVEETSSTVASTTSKEESTILPKSGQLTAAEWNDLHNWNDWKKLIKKEDYKNMESHWALNTQQRVSVLVLNELDFPVADAQVELKDAKGKVIWTSKTDNSGTAELWSTEEPTASYSLNIQGKEASIKQKVNPTTTDRNVIILNESCSSKGIVDIAFVVDATGSMGDEIRFLQSELTNVIERVSKENEETIFRTGAVFYQDEGDTYLTKKSKFTKNFEATNTWIAAQGAGGGGDYPEAVEEGLQDALNMDWSTDATSRLLFLVLDAPPHHTPAILEKLNNLTRQASEQGIKIIPITASGIDRETEFLMKMMSILTNGTYVFITDDSGIGNAHLAPVVNDFEVELLNDLLVRLISNYAKQDHCEDQQFAEAPFKVYPNPAHNFTKVEIAKNKTDLVLLAANGKVVMKKTGLKKGEHQLDVKHLAAGFYTVQLWMEDEKIATKLIITSNS